MNGLDKPYEIIFIDDGSTDRTYEILSQLRPIKIVHFRKNFGQTAALDTYMSIKYENVGFYKNILP